ncbi:DUF2537 domain-containing protein [Saccharopolyspora taberi]|uniref:DUF2537 domain-containing protein n=1 Tax=Saccharopolyspora taberi TaxID=60895 RepID=A0ABN3V899_9PSEU
MLVNGTNREVEPGRLPLPEALVAALHEWAGVAEAMPADDAVAEQVSARGRQLAMRLAVETGGEIGYADPVTGEVDRIGRRRPARPGQLTPPPPTPWATGLTVTVIIAAIVLIALVVVSHGLSEVNTWLAVGVNIVVAAGFAPSIWLGRRVPVWRWVAFGTAAGVLLAWAALLLSSLGGGGY